MFERLNERTTDKIDAGKMLRPHNEHEWQGFASELECKLMSKNVLMIKVIMIHVNFGDKQNN
jgi:hypothetical protein